MADDHDRAAIERGETAHDRGIVGEQAVAVQFEEVRERQLQIVERVGPLGMPRQLHALPGADDRPIHDVHGASTHERDFATPLRRARAARGA